MDSVTRCRVEALVTVDYEENISAMAVSKRKEPHPTSVLCHVASLSCTLSLLTFTVYKLILVPLVN